MSLYHLVIPISVLQLRDVDSYIPGNYSATKQQRAKANSSKDLTKILKAVDDEIRRILILPQERNIHPRSLFAHEFTPAPLSLCDNHNCELMNQQKKSGAIEFLKEQFPSAFLSSCPKITGSCALVIDGGSLLETRPASRNTTVRNYALQLLNTVIKYNFQQYERIDVIFDSAE
ncbi:unnamed protein product, partial [Didymodactylos carnosus]